MTTDKHEELVKRAQSEIDVVSDMSKNNMSSHVEILLAKTIRDLLAENARLKAAMEKESKRVDFEKWFCSAHPIDSLKRKGDSYHNENAKQLWADWK